MKDHNIDISIDFVLIEMEVTHEELFADSDENENVTSVDCKSVKTMKSFKPKDMMILDWLETHLMKQMWLE